jgi:predicted amidohydrolase YtcJ
LAKRGVSRRRFLGTTAGAAIGAASAVAGVSAQAQTPPPEGQSGPTVESSASDQAELVLVNGRIHTMDARNTVARTVTIRNGRFVAVGDRPPAQRAGARVIDLRGRTVVPGLIEAHVHIVSLANRPGYHTILENTRSIREIQEALAARRKDVPAGQWITSMGGWHPNQWAEHRHPTLKELDEAVPDRPVLLYERFTGPCATNSIGKAFFDKMDAGPKVHPDIKPVKVSDSGAIAGNGFTGGGPSASALFYLRHLQTFEDKLRSTDDAMRYAASVGLTTHLDQVLFPTGCTTPGSSGTASAGRSCACR